MHADRNLIFDLGLHRGEDSDYYLRKGFRVVALEANPDLVRSATARFKVEARAGRFTPVQKALWKTSGDTVTFHVNPEKDDWSSVLESWAGKGGHALTTIEVETLTLSDLFDAHGVPYYVKCDIEGADEVFVDQLWADERMPDFVSVEAASIDLVNKLAAKGYDAFQLVNQATLWAVPAVRPPREGAVVEVTFNGHMSGPFGLELPERRWKDRETISDLYRSFIRLNQYDDLLGFGWLDFHATTREALERRKAEGAGAG